LPQLLKCGEGIENIFPLMPKGMKSPSNEKFGNSTLRRLLNHNEVMFILRNGKHERAFLEGVFVPAMLTRRYSPFLKKK
jgi:hypothetical protein